MCRVTVGHLRVTISHLRVTIGHLRVTKGHSRITIDHHRVIISYFRVTLGHLKDGEGHFRVTIGHYRITSVITFLSLRKHTANTTELHPKVRQICIVNINDFRRLYYVCLLWHKVIKCINY